MKNNVIRAYFKGATNTRTIPAYQWNYGQILLLADLTLPPAYEVHFANSQNGESAEVRVGDADGVTIPNALFETGLYIYAWLYLHDDVTDGETVYRVTIPIIARPRPNPDEPTVAQESAITEAIAELNKAVAQTGADVQTANDAAERSETAAQEAATSETNAARSAQAAGGSATAAADSASAAAGSATAAAGSAATATSKATEAENSAADAKRDADRAEQAAALSGYMWFYVESGKLFMEKTANVGVDFYLQNGKLYVTEG